jgi:hypothetical protein
MCGTLSLAASAARSDRPCAESGLRSHTLPEWCSRTPTTMRLASVAPENAVSDLVAEPALLGRTLPRSGDCGNDSSAATADDDDDDDDDDDGWTGRPGEPERLVSAGPLEAALEVDARNENELEPSAHAGPCGCCSLRGDSGLAGASDPGERKESPDVTTQRPAMGTRAAAASTGGSTSTPGYHKALGYWTACFDGGLARQCALTGTCICLLNTCGSAASSLTVSERPGGKRTVSSRQ